MRRYKFELLFVQSPWKLGFLFIYRSVLLKNLRRGYKFYEIKFCMQNFFTPSGGSRKL